MPTPATTGSPSHDLRALSIAGMSACSASLRSLGASTVSMAEAAAAVTDHFRSTFRGPEGAQVALARLYKTHATGDLSPDLRSYADPGGSLDPASRCLVLLASRGVHPEWNAPERSRAHRVIPLPGTAAVERSPMIASLIEQLGLEPHEVVAPGLMLLAEQRTFNVFHVLDAATSPYVPAKDFVGEYGIRSVVGFGGLLPPGDLFAVVLFTTVEFDRDIADLFAPIALSVKLALLPHTDRVFT